jgi:hypothetical protein
MARRELWETFALAANSHAPGASNRLVFRRNLRAAIQFRRVTEETTQRENVAQLGSKSDANADKLVLEQS